MKSNKKPKISPTVDELVHSFMDQTEKQNQFENCVRVMLRYIGEDPYRNGLEGTPARVRRFFEESLSSKLENPPVITVFKEKVNGQIIQAGIPFSSFCEHHLMPFTGVAHVGYLPAQNRIIGISKLARIVDYLSRRPQVQERLTREIADFLWTIPHLKPSGVMIVVEASHSCMECRGVKKSGSRTVTSEIRGRYMMQPLREEFLALIKKS